MGVHALLCATWAFVRPSRRRARESAGAIVGELAGVAAAIVWATNNIVLRGQSARYGAVTVNAWRAVFASLCFAGIFLLTRGPADLVGIPAGALAALLAGVVAGMVIGDALQLVAMTWIGVSRAMPIGASFPLFTVAIAALFLGERIAARTILGATLVIGGIVLLALPRTPAEPVGLAAESRALAARADRRRHWQGVGLALLAALCWALATTFTRIAVREIDVITANAIRLPFSAVVSLLLGVGLGGAAAASSCRRASSTAAASSSSCWPASSAPPAAASSSSPPSRAGRRRQDRHPRLLRPGLRPPRRRHLPRRAPRRARRRRHPRHRRHRPRRLTAAHPSHARQTPPRNWRRGPGMGDKRSQSG